MLKLQWAIKINKFIGGEESKEIKKPLNLPLSRWVIWVSFYWSWRERKWTSLFTRGERTLLNWREKKWTKIISHVTKAWMDLIIRNNPRYQGSRLRLINCQLHTDNLTFVIESPHFISPLRLIIGRVEGRDRWEC